jgi:hypothetical protein
MHLQLQNKTALGMGENIAQTFGQEAVWAESLTASR